MQAPGEPKGQDRQDQAEIVGGGHQQRVDGIASMTEEVVERTFAWLGKCRRLAKDFERTIASAEAWVFIAHIRPAYA